MNSWRHQLIIAKSTKAACTSSRQYIASLLRNRTSQTGRESRAAIHRRHLTSVRNHPARLRRQILQLQRALPARKGVVVIRQIHNRDLARIVAPEERGLLIQTLAQECRRGRNDGHLGQSRQLGLRVRLVEFAAVGVIGARVGGIVVDQDDADGARGLQ